MGWHGVREVVRVHYGPSTNPHCRSGDSWRSVLHVFSEQNRHHKTVSRGHKRAGKIMRHMWQASLGARDMVQLICSLSDTMGNTSDIVYDIVYDIACCISYTISYVYTMSYTIFRI
jgi:hypothetical protein